MRLLLCVLVIAQAAPAMAAADELAGLEQRIRAEPSDTRAYEAYSDAAFAAGRFVEAAAQLERGVARIPRFRNGHYRLAYAYRKTRQWAKARAHYQVAISLAPDAADAYYGLALSLEALGDGAGALAAWQSYVRLEKNPARAGFVVEATAAVQRLQEGERASRQRATPRRDEPDASPSRADADAPVDVSGELMLLDPADDMEPIPSPHDLRDPFRPRPRRVLDLENPFPDDVRRASVPDLATTVAPDWAAAARSRAGLADRRLLVELGAALVVYRRALAHQAQEVASRYERGAALVLRDDDRGALQAWRSVPLADAEVETARRTLERLRARLTSP